MPFLSLQPPWPSEGTHFTQGRAEGELFAEATPQMRFSRDVRLQHTSDLSPLAIKRPCRRKSCRTATARFPFQTLTHQKAAFQMTVHRYKSALSLRSRQNVLHMENCSIKSGGFEPLAAFSWRWQDTIIKMFTMGLQFDKLGLTALTRMEK